MGFRLLCSIAAFAIASGFGGSGDDIADAGFRRVKSPAKLAAGQSSLAMSSRGKKRTVEVLTPSSPSNSLRPIILLHGNGQVASDVIDMWKDWLARDGFALLAPSGVEPALLGQTSGYSWNAWNFYGFTYDVRFLEDLVRKLRDYDNVDLRHGVTIIGTSMGCALAQTILVESHLPEIERVGCVVFPLAKVNHRDDKFYRAAFFETTPAKDRMLWTFQGADDWVPVNGGPLLGMPQADLHSATDTIEIWAKHYSAKGEVGLPLVLTGNASTTRTYLGGQVSGTVYEGQGHGLMTNDIIRGPLIALTELPWSHWLNAWDMPKLFECPASQAIAGFETAHSWWHNDRSWKVLCKNVGVRNFVGDRLKKPADMSEFHGEVNAEDDGMVLTGIHSHHDNVKEDRRFAFQYQKTKTPKKDCYDLPTTAFEPNWVRECGPNEFVFNFRSATWDALKRDRQFTFKCCKI